MFINGRLRLACNTWVTELGTSLVSVAPLPNPDGARPGSRPDADVDAHAALHLPSFAPTRRTGAADGRVLAVGPPAGGLPPVLLLHQVRLLHGGLPHLRDRPPVLGADAARSGLPLHGRQPGWRVRGAQGGARRRTRAVEVPLRRRVLAGVPEGSRPGAGHPADEANPRPRLPAPVEAALPAKLATVPAGIKRRGNPRSAGARRSRRWSRRESEIRD